MSNRIAIDNVDEFLQFEHVGDVIVRDPDGISNFARDHLGDVKRGDYVFITTTPRHGLLIVGWGEPLNCSDAVINITTDFSLSDFETTSQATIDLVPYVADFTVSQQPIPRPFYCTNWDQTNSTVLDFLEHFWYFFTLPDAVTFPSGELYVDEEWQWTSTDGITGS